jgi:hypothetical protein
MRSIYPHRQPLPFRRRVLAPSVVSGDVTAPVLSSPVGTATGSSTATVGATTDEGNGTLYAVVTVSGTAPTGTQVEAGQDNSGSAATWNGSQAIGSTGVKTIGATGLSASTAYYAHLMHKDAAGNRSNVVSSAQFTTDAAGGSKLLLQLMNMH